ncbi:MAG: hypothetical protein IPH11_12715 [Ignavibacteriales bacterium]|nr:hypothetical protein [Ignavibacteriales bacterium]
MKKILLIFGAEGALGKGVSGSLIKKITTRFIYLISKRLQRFLIIKLNSELFRICLSNRMQHRLSKGFSLIKILYFFFSVQLADLQEEKIFGKPRARNGKK